MSDLFKMRSGFDPRGDQPEAIRSLVEGVRAGDACQTLLGITGSGKTFSVANVSLAIYWCTVASSDNISADNRSPFRCTHHRSADSHCVVQDLLLWR